jgi:phage/plasmid-associated DNA primase
VSLYLAEATLEDAGSVCPAGDLYLGFKRWCEDNGHQPVSSTAFGRELTASATKGRTVNNRRVRRGLRMTEGSWV